MANGKIKTIFTDKEKTDAIFPRTKVKAVSTDDGVGLDAIINSTPHFSNSDATNAPIAGVDADTLGGRPASEFATNVAMESFVLNKIAEAQLGNEEGEAPVVDLSGLATKAELDTAKGSLLEAISKKADQYLTAEEHSADAEDTLLALIYRDYLLPMPVGGMARFWVPSNGGGCFSIAGGNFGEGALVTVRKTQNGTGDDYAFITVEGPVDVASTITNKVVLYCGIDYVSPNTTYPQWRIGGEWEWSNPPLLQGYEYRTTERWNGRPVYTKLIDVGVYPSNTHKAFSGVISKVDLLVSHHISLYRNGVGNDIGMTFTNSEIDITISRGGGTVYFVNKSDNTEGNSAYLTLKYVKE